MGVSKAETLREHGATDDEIDFLRNQRVELNAMPSDVFIAFLEDKLAAHEIPRWSLRIMCCRSMPGR